MSDKPEKIWVRRCPADCGADYCDIVESIPMVEDSTEYIRADLAKPSEWISAQLPPKNSSPVLARYRENQPFVARYVDLIWYDEQGQERDPSKWRAI